MAESGDARYRWSIAEVMTSTLEMVQPSDLISLAAQKMRVAGVGAVLVVEDEEVVGILTDRDIVIRAFGGERDPRSVQVGEVCSRTDLAFVGRDATLAEAGELMRRRTVRRLPIVESGRPLGIVSLGDLTLLQDASETLADLCAAAPNR